MQRLLSCLLFIGFAAHFSSAQTDSVKLFPVSTVNSHFSGTVISISDPYLSPLNYGGVGISMEQTVRKLFNPQNKLLSLRERYAFTAGLALNPAFSASMTYVGGFYNWGAFYQWKQLQHLKVYVGASSDIHFGVKTLARNINNPANMDMAINLNAAAMLRYKFATKKNTLEFVYEFETPFAGCMYVPVQGASYYEMFDQGNLKDAFHFSSFHNKQAYQSLLSLEIPLKRSVLSVGVTSQSAIYQANSQVYKLNMWHLNVGWMYNFKVFKRNENSIPANFIPVF